MGLQWYLLMTVLWFSDNILSFLWAKWATQIKLMEIVAGHHVWLRIRDPWVECPLRVVARAIHADTSVTWRITAHLWQVAAMRLPSFTCGVACLLMLPERHTTAVPDTTINVIFVPFQTYPLFISLFPTSYFSSSVTLLFYVLLLFPRLFLIRFNISFGSISIDTYIPSFRSFLCSFLRFFLSFIFSPFVNCNIYFAPVEAYFQIAMVENCVALLHWKYSPDALMDSARVFVGRFVERWSFDTRTVA